jgi:hypothetical protein
MAAKEIGGEGVKNQLLISMEKSKHFLVTQPLLFFFLFTCYIFSAGRISGRWCFAVVEEVVDLHVHVFCLL